jgi:hypothetical protein
MYERMREKIESNDRRNLAERPSVGFKPWGIDRVEKDWGCVIIVIWHSLDSLWGVAWQSLQGVYDNISG